MDLGFVLLLGCKCTLLLLRLWISNLSVIWELGSEGIWEGKGCNKFWMVILGIVFFFGFLCCIL